MKYDWRKKYSFRPVPSRKSSLFTWMDFRFHHKEEARILLLQNNAKLSTGACFSIPKCPFSLPYLFLGSMRPSKMLDLTLIREGLSWVRQVMIRKSWVIRPMKETHIIIDREVDRPQESWMNRGFNDTSFIMILYQRNLLNRGIPTCFIQ